MAITTTKIYEKWREILTGYIPWGLRNEKTVSSQSFILSSIYPRMDSKEAHNLNKIDTEKIFPKGAFL